MRSIETREEALRLAGLGLNDCEIARRLEIPRTTVRDWRKPRYVPRDRPACPLCGERSRPRQEARASDRARALAV